MAAPLAMCARGHVFEVTGLLIDPPKVAAFRGGSTTCPVCGSSADILPAEYLRDRTGSLNARLFLTPSQLRRLEQSLRWAQAELAKPKPDQDRAIRVMERTIEDTAPQMTGFLDKLRGETSQASAAWLGVLMSFVGVLLVLLNNGQGISAEELQQILDETVRAVQSEQLPAEQVEPTPPGSPNPGQEEPPTVTELPTPTTH